MAHKLTVKEKRDLHHDSALQLFRAVFQLRYTPLTKPMYDLLKEHVGHFVYATEDDVRLRLMSIPTKFDRREYTTLAACFELPVLLRGTLSMRLKNPMLPLFQRGVDLCIQLDGIRTMQALVGADLALGRWAAESEAGFAATFSRLPKLTGESFPGEDRARLSLSVPQLPFAARAALAGGLAHFHQMHENSFTGPHIPAWQEELGKVRPAVKSSDSTASLPPLPAHDPSDASMCHNWVQLFVRFNEKSGAHAPGRMYTSSRPVSTARVAQVAAALEPLHTHLERAGSIVGSDIRSTLDWMETTGVLDAIVMGFVRDGVRTADKAGGGGADAGRGKAAGSSADVSKRAQLLAAPRDFVRVKGEDDLSANQRHTTDLLFRALRWTVTYRQDWEKGMTNESALLRLDKDVSATSVIAGKRALSESQDAFLASGIPTSGKNSAKDTLRGERWNVGLTFQNAAFAAGTPLSAFMSTPVKVSSPADSTHASPGLDGWRSEYALPILSTNEGKVPKAPTGNTVAVTAKELEAMDISDKYALLWSMASVEDGLKAMHEAVAALGSREGASAGGSTAAAAAAAHSIFPYAAAFEFLTVGPAASVIALTGQHVAAELKSREKDKRPHPVQNQLFNANWIHWLFSGMESILSHVALSSCAKWILRMRELHATISAEGLSLAAVQPEWLGYVEEARAKLPSDPPSVALPHALAWATAMKAQLAEVSTDIRSKASVTHTEEQLQRAIVEKLVDRGFHLYVDAVNKSKLPAPPVDPAHVIRLIKDVGIREPGEDAEQQSGAPARAGTKRKAVAVTKAEGSAAARGRKSSTAVSSQSTAATGAVGEEDADDDGATVPDETHVKKAGRSTDAMEDDSSKEGTGSQAAALVTARDKGGKAAKKLLYVPRTAAPPAAESGTFCARYNMDPKEYEKFLIFQISDEETREQLTLTWGKAEEDWDAWYTLYMARPWELLPGKPLHASITAKGGMMDIDQEADDKRTARRRREDKELRDGGAAAAVGAGGSKPAAAASAVAASKSLFADQEDDQEVISDPARFHAVRYDPELTALRMAGGNEGKAKELLELQRAHSTTPPTFSFVPSHMRQGGGVGASSSSSSGMSGSGTGGGAATTGGGGGGSSSGAGKARGRGTQWTDAQNQAFISAFTKWNRSDVCDLWKCMESDPAYEGRLPSGKGSSPTFYKDKHKSLQQKNLLPARIPYAGKPGSAGAKRAAAAGGSGLQRRLSAAGGLTGGSSSHSGGLESSFSASKEDNKEDEDEKEEDEGMRGSREDERASDEEGRDEDMEGEAESDLIMRLTQRTTDKAASRKNGTATKRRNNASREEE